MQNNNSMYSERHSSKGIRKDISVLRIMATLCVVMIHTCNTITNNLESYPSIKKYELKTLMTVNGLVNWGVPMFFMITGCLLLKDEVIITYDKCIRRYVKRILLALIVFGITFSCMEIFTETRMLNLSIFIEGVLRTLGGNSWGHLWYLYELIGIYLILPIIKTFTDNASCTEFKTALIILFIFDLCIFTLNAFSPIIGFYLPIKGNALFYLMLGRYLDLRSVNIPSKLTVIILCLSSVILLGVGIIASKDICSIIAGYSSPVIALLSASIFTIILGMDFNKVKWLWKLDRLCFGVYLIHPVFTNFFYKFIRITPLVFEKYVLIGIMCFFLLFTMLGFMSSWIMNKIPLLKDYIL